MLKRLYLSPEIKMQVKTGLKAFIVCPYSRLRNKCCEVIDFKKNLKCVFDTKAYPSLPESKCCLFHCASD